MHRPNPESPRSRSRVSRKGSRVSRKERLLAIIERLRDGQLHLAGDLARDFGVSERSLYRDMDVLRASGVPVTGRRGTGYRMSAHVTLPPLNLTMKEMEALHLGVAVMTEASDPALQRAAQGLAAKLDASLPEDAPAEPLGWGMAVFPYASAATGTLFVARIRRAIRQGQKLRLVTQAPPFAGGVHIIWPRKLEYWGRVWTVDFHSETDNATHRLRLDQIEECTVLSATIPEERPLRP